MVKFKLNTLTHCILNRLSHTILEESNFNFRYVRLLNLHIPREKWLHFLQTLVILIRLRVLRRLIWVCTICQLSFYGSPDYNGLILLNIRVMPKTRYDLFVYDFPYDVSFIVGGHVLRRMCLHYDG